MNPRGAAVDRFADDLGALVPLNNRLGIAVSGGPDSLALLLLAAASRPGLIEAASVDHQLRHSSRGEAAKVAEVCAVLGVPHAVLPVEWDFPPQAALQARAREARYRLLSSWATERNLTAVATAHHADDQAETLLMRLARGAGIGGLRGTRVSRPLAPGIALVRPLLGWRSAELAAICADAGLTPVDDPSNRDPRHDRSRIRIALRDADWADPARLAASARFLGEADEALEWALAPLVSQRITCAGRGLTIDPSGLPRELQRRLLLAAIDRAGAQPPRGPELARAMEALEQGRSVTLAGLKLDGGPVWRLSPAPPRKH
jgi:tRNA(Ile)-lysidine synthase